MAAELRLHRSVNHSHLILEYDRIEFRYHFSRTEGPERSAVVLAGTRAAPLRLRCKLRSPENENATIDFSILAISICFVRAYDVRWKIDTYRIHELRGSHARRRIALADRLPVNIRLQLLALLAGIRTLE